MKQLNDTKSIGELLSDFNFNQKTKSDKGSMKYVIKHSTIFSFWGDIVGSSFARLTKPRTIKFQKLYVSAKSPVIIQELSLIKSKLLKKINTYSNPLGVEIKDIIFDYKSYVEGEDEAIYQDDKPLEYKSEDLEAIEIESGFEKDIEKSIDKIEHLSESQKKALISKIYALKKAKIKRNIWTN